jgi:methylmalonyl-CoA mutase N-terminal domain/subunit
MERCSMAFALAEITTSMTINSTASILLGLYVLVARRQGADLRKLSGTVQNDILKEYIARGTYIYPPRPAMRIITDMFAWAGRELPEWNTISISGYHIREAGSTAVQEVAFTFANAIAYISAAVQAGLDCGFVRAAPFVLLQRAQRISGRDRQVPRGAAHLRHHHARPLRRPNPRS